ncbi:ATP-dependent DNA ligase [Williamsia sp. CHRR-6]|uniref:ATP-dependent DNA ligase n=1 Tax=Williamsia sp. CHRR-6 TaxID=2835871 RepID=UPI001BDAFB4D|nr:ATP-dependent DNA ligase [Williamsia sp. CHRR-6]MBT0567324.1 ATP-dependent DNA ligase [Williamsia sp. CHRR-6]
MADTLDVDGHTISVTHLDKVLYPLTGTRKFEVIDYYNRISDVMLPHLRGRPITRKRWPDGVAAMPFFEKNLPTSAPDWIDRRVLEHSERDAVYPVATGRADLVWLGQQSALELHVPQWLFPDDGSKHPIDKADRLANRVVLDLDPGPGVSLHQCAEIALLAHDMLIDAGLPSFPVTSGSKGIHVYARLPRLVSCDGARAVARQIATALATQLPDRVTASMAKAARPGRVFIDWSQNSSSKTTLSPYSLRGRERPWVAAPRTWDELRDSDISQLEFGEVLARAERDGDLLAELDLDVGGRSDAVPPAVEEVTPEPEHGEANGPATRVVDLGEYRRKRDRNRTPEPFGPEVVEITEPSQALDDTGDTAQIVSRAQIFVIQEHHARRLHYDFRLERDGVLVSWAVPKNLPSDSDQNRLAVQTEDHPLDYADFEGEIPAGEYGGGHVSIFDRGTYETEKWREDEVIVRLHGTRISGRYALIRTGGKNWLAHLMADEVRPIVADGVGDPRPMLATDEPIDNLSAHAWAFEGKWDGYRILVRYIGGDLRLISRSGLDMTADFPQLHSLADDLGLMDVVLDGEVVAIDAGGHTNFTVLAARGSTDEPFTLGLYLFDILYLNGTSVMRLPWSQRRLLLEELAPVFAARRRASKPGDAVIEVPALLSGNGSDAMAHSREKGYEGVVAKRRDSLYQQGRRSTAWLKHKNWSDIEVVIGGWRPGKGTRSNSIGSLILGLPEETGLRYVGRVGTGFTDRQLAAIKAELEPLRRRTSPFLEKLDRPVEADAVWVLPTLVAEVRFMDWTSGGHLRHPSWRGIRRDKLPGDL